MIPLPPKAGKKIELAAREPVTSPGRKDAKMSGPNGETMIVLPMERALLWCCIDDCRKRSVVIIRAA